MANPYEGMSDNLIGDVQNLNIDTNTIVDGVNQIVDNTLVASTPERPTTTTEVVDNEPFKADTYAKRKERNDAFYAWRKFADGPYKDAKANEWSMKYHGMSYSDYEAKRKKESSDQFYSYLNANSAVFGPRSQERMMSIAAGGVDWLTDLSNWGTQSIRQPLKIGEMPKIPKFEDEGAQAMREISSLILPYFILRGKAIGGAGAVHKSGVAAKHAPWLYRLGNNPAFQRFAKLGLDTGVGGFTDMINKTNSVNDTLSTSWKRGKWWGHQLIPEGWTSDKLGPDAKHRANVLEGIRLGFYTDVAHGFVKLARAGKSVKNVTTFLADSDSNIKNLDALTKDPLDAKVFDDSNSVADNLLRGEAKYEENLKSLTQYYKDSNKLNVDKPTLGIHKTSNELQAGIITKDFEGIIGAAKNQAQIATNSNTTFGRLGNLITEGFRKAGVDDAVIADRSIIKSLRNDLIKGGKYSVKLPDGTFLPWKTIDSEGTILAEIISDPTLPRGSLVKILDNFKTTVDGVQQLNKVGFNALKKANKQILKDWADINTEKATAYFLTSEAGQIADLSEGARLVKNTDAVARANEQLLDRLELFEIESKIHNFNFKSRKDLLTKIKTDPGNTFKYVNQLDSRFNSKLSEIVPEAKKFRTMLSDIQTHNPQFAEVIRLGYELSDGNVRTIKDINHYISNTFGTWSKAIYDGAPEMPSIVYKSFMGNVFNSMLSAIGTPVKALYGNFGGFISEPASVFYGALRSGDAMQLRRSAHMYFGFTDTFQQGFQHMGRMFRKAAANPDDVRGFTRQDFDRGIPQNIELAEAVAEAAAKKGEYGPQALLGYHSIMDDLSKSPWFRFGPNAMTGLDGFTEATQKVAQDKGLAFDMLLEKYPDGKWSQKEFQELYEDLWNKGRDANGNIKSDAVDFARREIALNLDTPLTERLNPLLAKYPILRSIFWFPRTQANVLDMFGKYAPRVGFAEKNIGAKFAGEYADLFGNAGGKKVSDFSIEEIQQILAKHGMDMSGDPLAKFKHLRYKTQGRVAMGNMAVMGAWLLASQDRIRGYGHFDRKVQKFRQDQGWERKTIQGLDGKWYSYEFLGPLGDWLATTVTAMDNFDTTNSARFEQLGKKMGFILGAAVTNNSLLGTLEPLFDIMTGNETAVTRWQTQMTNAIFPLSNFRNELGKNLFGMLREVKYSDFGEMMRNKNNWLDVFDPAGAQAPLINFIDGKPINKAGDSVLARTAKTVFGFGGTANPSEESQFLMDIEYNMLPQFNTSSGGINYSSDQKAELKRLMGEDGYFNNKLKGIMKMADQMTYKDPETNVTIKGYVNIMRNFRRKGITGEVLENYSRIIPRINLALKQAQKRVETRLSTYNEIRLLELEKAKIKKYASQRNDKKLNETLGLTRN
tara:strand:- start:942 stop:5111 length:4170 start_codon:yes stop_codon:yes gene_type:complete